MGIFSFGKKDADAGRNRDRSRAARSEGRRKPASSDGFDTPTGGAGVRRSRAVGQEAMLDPTLPEKQRARRRLVGAVALVLAAIIILPMVLDSRPKPVTDDIAISIPNQDDAGTRQSSGASGRASDAQVSQSTGNPADAAAPDSPPGTTDVRGDASNGTAPPASTGKAPATAATDTRRAGSSNTNTANATPPAARPAPARAAPPGPAAAEAPRQSALPPTPATPGSRYVVQLGVFDSDASAQEWVGKLKNIGVPAYIEHVKQPDGGMRAMLRAGPFADRTTAQNAVTKVRQAGLSQAGR
jgi:DedD protein